MGNFDAVEVPFGFVTDLASIPAIFYSMLRPDAEYAYAAIVHDFMYWTQTRPRDVADSIFRLAMQDFNVGGSTIATLYYAVRSFGQGSWDENAKLRGQGEKRILKIFPPNAGVSWNDWKKRADVFV
jgi:hypothetical protein